MLYEFQIQHLSGDFSLLRTRVFNRRPWLFNGKVKISN